MAQFETDSENSDTETLYSEECVPLKQRFKKLLASHRFSYESDEESKNEASVLTPNLGDAVTEKRENKHTDSLVIGTVSREERHGGKEGECDNRETLMQKYKNSSQPVYVVYTSERVHSVDSGTLHRSLLPKYPATVKVEHTAYGFENPETKCMNDSCIEGFQAASFEPEMSEESLDELDRVVLKERLMRILSSKSLELKATALEERVIGTVSREERHGDKEGECDNRETLMQKYKNSSQLDSGTFDRSLLPKYPATVKVEHTADGFENPETKCMNDSCIEGFQAVTFEPEMSEESLDELDRVVLKERLMRILSSKSLELKATALEDNSPGASHPVFQSSLHQTAGTGKGELTFCDQKLPVPGDSLEITRNDRIPSSGKTCSKSESSCGKALSSGDIRDARGSTTLNLVNIKIEPPNCNEFESFKLSTVDQMSFRNLVPMKKETETPGDSYEDELDHMLLRDRMKLLSPKNVHRMNISQSTECLSRSSPSALSWNPVASENTESPKVNRPRKKRKTVTDSIETALEEDAPGLLKVLIENGVSVNEIKLYGEPEGNNDLDDTSTKDNFEELEAVITKLFTRRDSFLKLGPFRCAKGEKASYCLACLFSLVEQARYLQFRNWPVEWGWCRDLQSFIFVFERHNRIVLERPEYGYATYFFELEGSLPIDWQIKRLVTAMKLTSCSRVTLIENKALMLGDDLTEREARVLMEYGWIPNTGLGTMLNYYDRVVHDRKNEKYSSEWSSKIGKLLMDGYKGGTIISAGIPKKVVDRNVAHPQEIKLELD